MTSSRNKAPSFFNFLKEGLLLPSRNRRLFTAVCALILASTKLLALVSDLAAQPLGDQIQLDHKALNTTEPGSQENQNDTKELQLVWAGYLLFSFVVSSAVRIVVNFAAVSTYSDEQRTTSFRALLGQAKAQIKAPLLTHAFVEVLGFVSVMLLTVVMALIPGILAVLLGMQYFATSFLPSLVVMTAGIHHVCFSFLCSFSVVVAVAEPGCHGAAALGKAWRLANGRKWQVVLYVRRLAMTRAGNSLALELLLSFVHAVLLALLQLFAACAMTAFYYDSTSAGRTGEGEQPRENSNSRLGSTGFAKLSTEEANA